MTDRTKNHRGSGALLPAAKLCRRTSANGADYSTGVERAASRLHTVHLQAAVPALAGESPL